VDGAKAVHDGRDPGSHRVVVSHVHLAEEGFIA
jgi:hypothetical protein